MNSLENKRLNWDNSFSIRFKLENGKGLKYIPNYIFEISLPDICVSQDSEKYIGITLQSSLDGLVEKELYDTLFRTNFDIELSLSNPNKIEYEYKSCSVDRLTFAKLANKPKANPFNFTVWARVSQIIYRGSDDAVFGEPSVPVDYQNNVEDTEVIINGEQ